MASALKLGANAPPSAADSEASRQFLAWAEEHRVVGAGGSKSLHAIQRSLAPVNCCMVAVQGGQATTRLIDSVDIQLMVEISTDPLHMFVRLWVCFNPRSTTPGELFAKERIQAVFRTYVNGAAAQKRQSVPWNGYIRNPRVPGPQSYSIELQNLQITKDLSQAQRALIPAKLPGWKDGRLTYMMSWNAASYVRIDQLPKDPSDKQKEACKLFDAFLKEGLSGKFYVLVANGDKIMNQMNQLASAPTSYPPSYWPWMNGSFGVGDDGLVSPLAFNPRDFDRSRPESHSWIHKAFVERDGKALLAKGVKAAETTPVKFSRMYPQTRFIDSRQYFAHQALAALYEAREAQEGNEIWANGDHRCFVVPDKNTSNRYAIFLNIRKPDATDNGLAENAGAGLPEVGERVSIEIRMDEKADAEQWWGSVARIPNKYANLGCNVAVVATRPSVRGGEVKEPRTMSANFVFGYPNTTLHPMLEQLGLLCFGNASKWFLELLLCQKPPVIQPGDVDLPGDWRATVEKIAASNKLNPEQLQAVMSFYSNRVSLVVGPPGTGKSTVIDTILQINYQLRKKFWVMAESNKAVDVLVEKFCKRHKTAQIPNFYRVKRLFQETLLHDQERGGWTSSGLEKTGNDALDAVQLFFDETKDAQHKLALGTDMARRLEDLDKDGFKERWKGEKEMLKDVRSAKAALMKIRMEPRSGGDPARLEKEWREFEADARAKFSAALFKVQRSTIGQANGIFSTTAAASTRLVEEFSPTSIIIDESSQAGECGLVSTLAGILARRQVARILLVGDHHQLPPVVVAKMNPLGAQGEYSLFERLITAGFPSTTLATQYRMHPNISRIANAAVYGKKLRDGPDTMFQGNRARIVQGIFKKLWSGKPAPTTNSVVISLTKYKDWHLGSQQRLTSTSRFNPHSAYVVAQIVNFLIKEKIPEKDIMVLSFYLDQVRFHMAVLGDVYPQLRICTVDSSQGSQAAVVIVDSVVLGGATGETVGFLGHEYRRVNVAMSRAEVGRILVGHKDFCKNKKFDKGNYWLQFYDQEKNHVVDDTKIRDWELPQQVVKAFNDAKAGFEKPPLQQHVNMARHRGNTRHAEAMVASMRAKPANSSQDAMPLTRTPHKNPSRPKPATAEFVEMTGIDWKLAERYMNSTRGNVEEALRQMRKEEVK